jgi:hypothetical protein
LAKERAGFFGQSFQEACAMTQRHLVLLVCFIVAFAFSSTLSPPDVSAEPLYIIESDDDNIIPLEIGDYVVDGGGGIDTLQLPLFPNEYKFTFTAPNHYTATYLAYTLEIDNIEYVQFGSETKTTLDIALLVSGDVQTKLARLTDLYLAFFGRAPDVLGLEYWQYQLLGVGRDFALISRDFSWSDEAKGLFPSEGSNRDFVQTVYLNSFGRNPDDAGWDYWTGKLDELDPQDPEFLNDRGSFVGELILGAYAPTSGEEDRSLLTNRHDVALSYVNKLAVQPEEEFDESINDLLTLTTGDRGTYVRARHVLDHVFNETLTLSGLLDDQDLFNEIWLHEPSDDVDDDGDGYSEYQGDCNDAVAQVYPGRLEICGDGIDQDCNGTDEACPVDPNAIDDDGDGLSENQGDCNDADSTIYPAAVELCGDGIDQDCSGADLLCPEDLDDDGDGVTESQGDCNDNDSTIHPGAVDICGDGIDQDCSGADELCPLDPNDVDDDGDGLSENQGDCNDADSSIYPAAVELCGDGIDQDCSGADIDCTSPILAAPSDGVTIEVGEPFQYLWVAVPGTTEYEVQISVDADFKVKRLTSSVEPRTSLT